MAALKHLLQAIAQGYGWVLLTPSARVGALFCATTLLQPAIGLGGLLGALCGWLAGRWQRADEGSVEVHVFNGLLAGLALGAAGRLMLIPLAALLASLLVSWFGAALWRFGKLPVLSLPFVLAVSMLALAKPLAPAMAQPAAALFGGWVDVFLLQLGGIFLLPQPLAGLCLFVGLGLASRYLAALALLGFAADQLLRAGLGLPAGSAFNAMLTTLAVGGLFAVPGWGSLALALGAALLATVFDAAGHALLAQFGLAPLSLPFVASTWLVLYAARQAGRPQIFLEQPRLPEQALEAATMQAARIGRPGSIGLELPVLGEWRMYQGFDGPHTHRGPWRHALDLIVTEAEQSFHGSGTALADYYAFGLPVLAPCGGYVVQVVNDVPDNPPGAMNLQQNWGNYLLLRRLDGACVLLAHLRQGSVVPAVGAWVDAGAIVGACGNSGRSPQPHLHLSVLSAAYPAAATLPFHLSAVAIGAPGAAADFHLASVPAAGTCVSRANGGTLRPFPLLAGRGWSYCGADGSQHSLQLAVQLDGRYRIQTGRGAGAFAEDTGSVFACYGRDGGPDRFLDLLLLAAGFTPAAESARAWHDRPPSRLLPTSAWRLLAALWPFAASLYSNYRRQWDEQRMAWRQTGEHRLFGGVRLSTEALISPSLGLLSIEARSARQLWRYTLTSAFQQADLGVPRIETPVANAEGVAG